MSHPFPSISQKPSLYHVFFCSAGLQLHFHSEMRKLQGDWIPLDPMTSPPKKSMKMPRAMDPSRPWSRMTTPFRNWEASLQQFRTMDALLENAEKSGKKWLSTIDCHGRTWKTTGFLIVAWSQDQTKRNTESTASIGVDVYYYIYIYMWYAVYCCMLLVDLCGCWLIQMSGAMEFLHVLVQWWVFPLSRQSSTNHWNMAGNHETRTIQDISAMFFAADLG